jgi:predicted TIM-barrel fold metal-dependent hydrolase
MAQQLTGIGISEDFIPVRPDWVNSRLEEVIEPDLPIVDPHHHLWDHPGSRYLLPELLADCGSGHRILATVYLECRAMYRADGPEHLRSLGETEFVNGVAAMSASGLYGPTRACAGIVGNVDLRIGADAKHVLEAHIAVAGGRFRGIRRGSAWHADGIKATTANPPPGLLLDPAFRRGFACLRDLNLSFDIWSLHTQLDEVLDLVRSFPDTTMVLDHVGGPLGIGRYAGQRDAVMAEWSASIRRLAACPNLYVKLGGLAMHLLGWDFHSRPLPPSSEELAQAWRPYVETCIEAFGVQRCMFESNFPVDKGTCSYRHLWNAFKRITKTYSADERTALFSGTAAKVYRLNLGEMRV